jgi:hypothetical protein
MVGNDFNPSSVILSHSFNGVVAYVGRSVLSKVKLATCTKRTLRIMLVSDEYLECVETSPRVFEPVTARVQVDVSRLLIPAHEIVVLQYL